MYRGGGVSINTAGSLSTALHLKTHSRKQGKNLNLFNFLPTQKKKKKNKTLKV